MRGVRLGLVFKLALLSALCAGASCGTPTFVVQEYPGPARAAETIAILRVDGSGTVQLLSLDDEATDARVTPDARLHIEVLPGNHRLWVQSLVDDAPAQSLVFRAEAGKVYRVEFARPAVGGAASPRVYEVDRSSNALKADVTAVQAPPEAAPSRPPRVAPSPAPIIVEQAAPTAAPADAGAPSDIGVPNSDAGVRAP